MLRANRPILAYFDAIKSLRVRQLALILKAGYDPNLMINSRGQNGLQFMINYFGTTEAHFRLQAPINKSAYLSVAKLLLDSGLDANAMDLLTDETVLFDAIRFNDREMVSMLMNYVDLSLRNKNGETALMCAARFGSKQVVRLLLDHLRHLEMDGYFLRQRNRFGLSALELARAENLEAAKVLTKHLIAYGLGSTPGAAMLARSSSHHQLAAAAGAHGRHAYRGVGCSGAAAAGYSAGPPLGRRAAGAPMVAGLDDFSPSDFSDSAEMLAIGPPGPSLMAPANPRAATSSRAARMAACAYYDPKAAQFNQYLLEQQDSLAGRTGQSDDELLVDQFGGGAGGQLIRSRSCMLGPSAPANTAGAGQQQQQQQQQQQPGGPTQGAGQQKYGGQAKKSLAGEQANNWQDGQ